MIPSRSADAGRGVEGMAKRSTAVVLLAAGRGLRMGGGEPKAFADLCGLPMFAHSLRVFQSLPWVKRIALVVGADEVEAVRSRHAAHLAGVELVAGGAQRQDSVRLGLRALGEDCEWVMVHDAARPLIQAAEVEALGAAMENGEVDGAILALPCRDTLKKTNPNPLHNIRADVDGPGMRAENQATSQGSRRQAALRIDATIDRDGIWVSQTPQIFQLSKFRESHEWLAKSGMQVTDDSQLYEIKGFTCGIVSGKTDNFKVTFSEDLDIARVMFENRRKSNSKN